LESKKAWECDVFPGLLVYGALAPGTQAQLQNVTWIDRNILIRMRYNSPDKSGDSPSGNQNNFMGIIN